MRMDEIVASVAVRMLHDLLCEAEASEGIKIADQVMGLVSLFRRTQNLLKNGPNSERVLRHIQKTRDLAYVIEDVLETCAVEVAFMFQKHEERSIKRRGRNDGVSFESIRAKILGIEPQIKNFNQAFPDDGMEIVSRGEEPLVGVFADGIARWPIQMYPSGVEEHFVGREDDLRQLVALVLQEQHSVISIWGVRGLGKTAIARKVYNHAQVRRWIDAFAWVSFSQEREIGVLLQDIARQLGSGNVEEIKQGENLIYNLWEFQSKKYCLIVLDSISEIDQWQQIRSAFNRNTKTKILITTRKQDIANVGFSYKLRLFHEDEGWELLKEYAFPRNKAPDFGILPKLGKEIVRKCGYLPFAISSLGRNLTNKNSLSEWQKAIHDIAKHMQSDFHNPAQEEFVNILDSEYDHLPYYSKQCLLYLGMFKENEDIDAEDLIFLWMGEGMIPSADQETQGTVDIAEYYLRNLAFRGMLQVHEDEFSVARRFKVCCLHNHSRELLLYQGGKEDFRLKVMDFCYGKQPMLNSSTLSDGTRRLAIHFNEQVNSCSYDLVKTDHLRSLLFLNSDQRCADIPLRISYFGKFKLLRTLQFVRCKFEGRKLPEGIDKLVNLRYLGLLYCALDGLPSSISNLTNLLVLYIRVHDNSQMSIPNTLSNMVLLKHLRLPDYSECGQVNKLILSDLLELETLVGFNSLIHDISNLSNLKKLRHLVTHAYSNNSLTSIIKFVTYYGARIRTNLYIENECSFTSPEGLAILEELLMCPNLHALTLSMVLIYKFPSCGTHICSDLTQLKLVGCRIKEDPMGAIGKFPNLRKLCLGFGAFVGREMIVDDTGFVNLEYLEFRSLPNLEEWRVDEGALRRLFALKIRRCPKLEAIPNGLTSISTLKSMEIELAAKALADGREGEYCHKFAFVHSFVIRELDPSSTS